MKKDLIEHIEKLLNVTVTGVKQISEGHSSELKYALETNASKLFVRVLPYSKAIEEKYNQLMCIGAKQHSIMAPILVANYKHLLIVVFNWFEGITLEDFYHGKSINDQLPLAIKVGKAIRQFHDATHRNKSDALTFVTQNAVNDFCANYLDDKTGNAFKLLISDFSILNFDYSLIHYDLRPANIMVGTNDEIVIIDFEYMSFQPSLADLTCSLLFSEKYRGYGYGLIYGYFDGRPTNDFWKKQKSLLAIELLRYAANPRNQKADIKKKISHIESYMFSNDMLPVFFVELDTWCQNIRD